MGEIYERDDTVFIEGIELYPIPDHPGFFADVEDGSVYNYKTGNWLGKDSKGSKRTGYVYVSLKNSKGEISPINMSWAIYTAYHGTTKDFFLDKGMTLHHISGNKADNSIFNLIPLMQKHQFKDPETIKRLKNRSSRRLTPSEKDTLEAAWELEENPVRAKFVNEWSEKMDIHWRSMDNHVKKYLVGDNDEE